MEEDEKEFSITTNYTYLGGAEYHASDDTITIEGIKEKYKIKNNRNR